MATSKNSHPAKGFHITTQSAKAFGLNTLTRPFEYIKLNGKLQLYARKDATEQLRDIHGVSITDLEESEREGVYIVTAKAVNSKGRTDIAKGAVSIKGLSGDNLANAIMKSETKAKRRVTLSICGLGWLDETEIETIPDARPVVVTEQGEIVKEQPAPLRALPGPQPVTEAQAVISEPGATAPKLVTESLNTLQNRAKAIAAMGLVGKDAEGFNVTEPGWQKEVYRVWKDGGGKVQCSCASFREIVIDQPKFRCEHILAVKYHLDVEPVKTQPTEPQQAPERDWRIEIDVMWRTLWNAKVRGFESREACLNHLVTTALSYKWIDSANEIKSHTDIGADQAEKYYSILCDLYEKSKEKDERSI